MMPMDPFFKSWRRRPSTPLIDPEEIAKYEALKALPGKVRRMAYYDIKRRVCQHELVRPSEYTFMRHMSLRDNDMKQGAWQNRHLKYRSGSNVSGGMQNV